MPVYPIYFKALTSQFSRATKAYPFKILHEYKNGDVKIKLSGVLFRVMWMLLFCFFSITGLAAQIITNDSRDSLVWQVVTAGDATVLYYSPTRIGEWTGSYYLEPQYQWSNLRWDTITRQWESTFWTVAFQGSDNETGQRVQVMLSYSSYHDRIHQTRHTYLEGVRIFRLE